MKNTSIQNFLVGLCVLCDLRARTLAINHATPEEIAFGTAVNIAPIDETTDDWIVISPYGEFPNEKGSQIVDRESANAMVTEFNSVLGKLGRLFRGAPIYRGHPDARPDMWPDDIRYGRINALEARDDGLYGKVAWNDLGVKNKEQGYYVYPSPAWNFKKLEGGKIKPNRLKSVGLTNNPNIFEAVPLTNSITQTATTAKSEQQQQQKETMNREALIKALGLKAEATDGEIITAINTLQSERDTATNAEKNPLVIAANAKVTDAQKEAKKFKTLAINHELTVAINDGRLTAAEKPQWQTKFEEDFDKAGKELKDKQPALNTASLNLKPNGKDLSDASKRRIAFNARLDELMQPDRDGRSLTIDQAISKMRANADDKALLDAMQQPIAA